MSTRAERKNKSVKYDHYPLYPQPKRKHYSTANSISHDIAKLTALEIIQAMLERVYQQEICKENFIRKMRQTIGCIERFDQKYFGIEDVSDEEVMCKIDEEPVSDQRRVIGTISNPPHLKKASRKKFVSGEFDHVQQRETRMSIIMDPDRRDKEGLIQKLKKEYSCVLNSKYFSQSRPIEQSRSYFQENDQKQITLLRKNLSKAQHSKGFIKSKPSKIQEQLRKGHKLSTIFKKSKDFIDKIDPTNSLYVSKVQKSMNVSRRGSFLNLNREYTQMEDSVLVKETPFKEISSNFKYVKQNVNEKPVQFPKQIDEASQIILNILVEQQREELRLRVERSFHSKGKAKLKEAAEQICERKPTKGSSLSVGLFPKISQR